MCIVGADYTSQIQALQFPCDTVPCSQGTIYSEQIINCLALKAQPTQNK